MQHAGLDPVDRFITHVIVSFVSPPDEHVGLHQNVLGKAIFWLIERYRADVQFTGGAKTFGDRTMNSVRIDRSIAFVLAFMPVFVPDGDPNLIHATAPSVVWRRGSLTAPPPRLLLRARPNGRSPR